MIYLSNSNLINLKFGFEHLKLEEIKSFPKGTIYSNPIYLYKLKNRKKEVVLKFYKNKKIMKKEIFCNTYLKSKGLSVPIIISYSEFPRPYVIMDKIQGKKLSNLDIPARVKDLARVHINSLNDISLNQKIPKFTKEDRIKSLKRSIKILKSNSLIVEDYFSKFDSLITILKKINHNGWEQCFCFNDFFINNSMKSKGRIYYFDFEKAVASPPFVDVGCIVINYPKEYNRIKSLYTKNITLNFKSKGINKVKDYLSNLNIFMDLGVCEKVIEDAAFLSDDSIQKTKDNNFCQKLAKRRIENVSFILDNLKNNLIGKK